MKALVGAFNQEKALVGAFSVITNLRMELFEALVNISSQQGGSSSRGTLGAAAVGAGVTPPHHTTRHTGGDLTSRNTPCSHAASILTSQSFEFEDIYFVLILDMNKYLVHSPFIWLHYILNV